MTQDWSHLHQATGSILGLTPCHLWPLLQAVKRFMKLECKCHGVSGSCSLRTCWLAMADFRRTGDYLRKKYNTAIEVTMNQDGTGFMVADKDFKGSTKNELVYVENSPDYCLTDRPAGEWRSEWRSRLRLWLFRWKRGTNEELFAKWYLHIEGQK